MRNTALCLGLAVSVFAGACGDEDDPVIRFDVQDVNVTTPEDTPFKVQVPVVSNLTVQATITTPPQHGTIAQTEPTIYTYTPAENYNGPDSVGITFNNGKTTQVGTAHIMVTPVNDPPTAQADAFAAGFATSIDIQASTLLMNDTDIENGTLSVTGVSPGTHGSVTLSAGKVTFTPENGFTGAATFSYQVSDGEMTSNGNVSVTVGANNAPVAVNDTVAAVEDTAKTVTVMSLLANDTDADMQTLSISEVGGATHGTVALQGTNITFTPDPNYNGAASFTYRVSDGGSAATGTVMLTIAAVNDAPTVVNDTGFTATEDAMLVLTAAQLLGNDSDVDGDTLRITAVGAPSHGTVTLPASAVGDTVAFMPTANYAGPAGFDYTVTDGTVTATGHVTFNVGGVNDAPVAGADSAAGMEDMPFVVSDAQLLSNDSDIDGDTLTITSVDNATHGTISLATGMITFIPDPDYSGPASFQYTITDGLVTATATVSLTIAAVNDAPNAVDDILSTTEDTPVVGMVATNDTDVDGGPLTVSATTNGAHGTVTAAGNTVTYTPAANYFGNDQFTYTINDGAGGTSVATVTVTISSVNDLPLAAPDTLMTDEDVAASIDVKANDSDADGDSLSVVSVTPAAHGTVVLVLGVPKYTPAPDYNGPDMFGYAVSDGQGGLSNGTVTIAVKPVNDAPIARTDTYFVDDEVPFTTAANLGVLANDTDIDSTLTAVLGAPPATGALTFNADGSFTYTADSCASGVCFSYAATDGMLQSPEAQVCFNINHRPEGYDDYYYVTQGETINAGACYSNGDWSVLCSDYDPDGDSLTASLASNPSGASAFTFNPDGTFSYTASFGFNGYDAFEYTVSDGRLTTLLTAYVYVYCANFATAPGTIAHGGGCTPAISIGEAAEKAAAAIDADAQAIAEHLTVGNKCGNGSGGCGSGCLEPAPDEPAPEAAAPALEKHD